MGFKAQVLRILLPPPVAYSLLSKLPTETRHHQELEPNFILLVTDCTEFGPFRIINTNQFIYQVFTHRFIQHFSVSQLQGAD